MTRLAAIGAAFSVLVATTSLARAQSEQPTDIGTAARCSRDVNGCTEHPELLDAVKAAADQANVSPTDLLGAVNDTHMDPWSYLCAADGLLCPAVATPHGYSARVRLTYYVESGITYSGGHPYAGSTACSWNFRIGQHFRLPDGEVVVCNDRGLLGSGVPYGWLDLWRRPDLARTYGLYATVEVIP